MAVVVLFLCILLAGSLSGLILPMTTPVGSTDMASLLSHVSLLEQNLASLQTTTTQLQTDLQVTKNKLQNTQSELQRTKKDLQSTQAELQTMKGEEERRLDKLEKDVNTTSSGVHGLRQDLQATRSDLSVVETNLSLTNSEMSTLKRNMSGLEKQSLDNKQALTQVSQTLVSKTRTVAFHLNEPPVSAAAHKPLQFYNVNHNAGSGYNNSTGKFTAPVSGTYMFWTQLQVKGYNEGMYVRIMKAGMALAAGYVEIHSSMNTADASAVTVTHLDKDEQVWVVPLYLNGVLLTKSYFGGALLSVD
ncbi:golgin subfamily A member 5-like [Haliotis cracherodii]|uniref:golgin subfamily A member 5-like n=1 Tax=Haliotis cracherodii TaxID=6455 RepID=UPI0039EC9FC8